VEFEKKSLAAASGAARTMNRPNDSLARQNNNHLQKRETY
jgi:hypothetical protein